MRYLLALTLPAIICAQVPMAKPIAKITLLKVHNNKVTWKTVNAVEAWITTADGDITWVNNFISGSMRLPVGSYIFSCHAEMTATVSLSFEILPKHHEDDDDDDHGDDDRGDHCDH